MSKITLDYEDQMLLVEIEGYARDGYDDFQIAEILGISESAFSRNKRKKRADGSDSLLSLALRAGRRPLEVMVENSLYKRAMGMKVKTTTITRRWMVIEGMGETPVEVISETETEQEIPPDFNCIHLWLRAKKSDMYNIQPTRIDLTSAGKALEGPPRISEIKHVTISSDDVKKSEVDV